MKITEISNEFMKALVKLNIEEIHDEIKRTRNKLAIETVQENIDKLELSIEIYNDRIMELKFQNGNSIEKKKIKGGEYKYYVADINGKKINEISDKYYNPKEIGTLSEVHEDEDGKLITQIYHRFYEFTYKDTLPKYKLELEERGLIIDKTMYDWDDDEDLQQWTSETTYTLNSGGEIIELKAIFNDNGEQIISKLKSVDKYIPEIGFIVTLFNFPIGNYKDAFLNYDGWWTKEWSNAIGEENILQGVINMDGKFIIEPWRSKITYLGVHNLFSVLGNTYNHFGIRQNFNLEIGISSLYQKQIEENFKLNFELEKKEKYLIFSAYENYKYGIIMNGTILCNPRFDNILFSINPDIFIVNNDKKFGFISADLFQESIILKETDIKFDELFELSKWGYLCKSISENTIYFFDGFSEETTTLSNSFNTLNEIEVLNILNKNNSQKIFIANRIIPILHLQPYQ